MLPLWHIIVRVKDEERGESGMNEPEQNGDKKKPVVPIWFIVLVLLLLGFALFGDRGVLQVYKAYLQKTELEEKIAGLEKMNIELRKEIDALHNDLKTIESIARRELGMVRPDEQVYQFHESNEIKLPQYPEEGNSRSADQTTDGGQLDSRPDGG